MSRRGKKLLITILILWIGMMMRMNKVEAALQSNGGTPLQANLNDWIYYTRKMQEAGGTLGLTDTINDDLTSSNKNLDIHMEKNTEYGAMVILSASSYGNPNKIIDGQTTTGNASGIVMKLNKEWVAAGTNGTKVTKFNEAAKRYWNQYTTNTNSVKNGDATTTVSGWHQSGASQWFYHTCPEHRNTGAIYGGFVRAYSGSVFSYYGFDYDVPGTVWDLRCTNCAPYNKPTVADQNIPGVGVIYKNALYTIVHPSRAAVVVGSGV